MLVEGQEVGSQWVGAYCPSRGGGVIGRYGTRPLSDDRDWPESRALTVDEVRLIKRGN